MKQFLGESNSLPQIRITNNNAPQQIENLRDRIVTNADGNVLKTSTPILLNIPNIKKHPSNCHVFDGVHPILHMLKSQSRTIFHDISCQCILVHTLQERLAICLSYTPDLNLRRWRFCVYRRPYFNSPAFLILKRSRN